MAGFEICRSNVLTASSNGERLFDASETPLEGSPHEPALENLTAIGRALFNVTSVRVLTLEQHEQLLAGATGPTACALNTALSAVERRQRREPVVVLDTLKKESWSGSALVRQ